MTGIVMFGVGCGIVIGLSISFYFISQMALESNEIGNYKGDRFDYIQSWSVIQEQDGVPRNFNIDYTRKDWEAEQFAKGKADLWNGKYEKREL